MSGPDHTGNNGDGGHPPSSHTLPTPRSRGWITVKQFAELQGVTYRTVLRWIFEERVLVVEVGNRKRIYEDEIRYQLENGTRPPNPDKLGKWGHSREEFDAGET